MAGLPPDMATRRRQASPQLLMLPVVAVAALFLIGKAEAEEAGVDVLTEALTALNSSLPCDTHADCSTGRCLRIDDLTFLDEYDICKELSMDAICFCTELPEVAQPSVGTLWCDHYAHCASGKCLRLEDQHLLAEDELCLEVDPYHTCICVDEPPSYEVCTSKPAICTNSSACLGLGSCELVCLAPDFGPYVDVSSCSVALPPQSCTASCEQGFAGGSTSLACSSAAEGYKGESLECTPKGCTNYPTGLGVDSTSCYNIDLGTTCTAKCFGKFEGPDKNYTCTPGMLTPVDGPIACELASCKTSEGLPSGNYDTSSCPGTRVGQSCVVYCGSGYTGISAVYSCQEDGSFVGMAPTCVEVDCELGLPTGLGVDAWNCLGMTAGRTCEATCSEHYEGDSQTFVCGDDGWFTGTNPTCKEKKCTIPSGLEKISVAHNCVWNGKQVAYGQECLAHCGLGFSGGSVELLSCDSPPVLSGTAPDCPLANECTINLPIGWGLNSSECEGKTTAETCTLTCEDGFESKHPSVDPKVTCQPSNSFTDAAFECKPKTCSDLSTVSGFDIPAIDVATCDGLTRGQPCIAYCAWGYTHIGTYFGQLFWCDARTMAESSAGYLSWDESPPNLLVECEPLPCTYNVPSSIGIQHDCDGKKTGETCTVSKIPGAFLYAAGSSAQTWTCSANGAYMGEMPRVQPAPCEPLSMSVTGAETTCANRGYGSFCWTYCGYGYKGNFALYKCRLASRASTPSWSLVSFYATACTASVMELQAPQAETAAVAGGCDASEESKGLDGPQFSHNCLGIVTNGMCIVECALGYTISGDPVSWTCSSSGSFTAMDGSSKLPTCDPNKCTAGHPSGVGMAHDCSDAKTAQKCTASCTAGYSGSSTTFTCQTNGGLTGTQPTCTPNPCSTWTTATNNEVYDAKTCEGTTTGQKCIVGCNNGWTISGDPKQNECSASGSFTGSLPTCIPRNCTSGMPKDSDLVVPVSCNTLTTGQECTVTCAQGYEAGSAKYTCSTNGVVTGTRPTCKKRKCANTVPSAGVYPVYSNTCGDVEFNNKCLVGCGKGYTLRADQSGQEWQCKWDSAKNDVSLTGRLPVCDPVPCEYNLPYGNIVVHNCSGLQTSGKCTTACSPGYVGGTESYTCADNRAFVGNMPSCTAKECPDRPEANVEDWCDNIAFSSSCWAMCGLGYTGPASMWTCAVDKDNTLSSSLAADWSVSLEGSQPQCVPEPCLYNMPFRSDIVHTCGGIRTGETCIVNCKPPFVGATSYACGADNAFVGSMPNCTTPTVTVTYTTTSPLTTTATTRPLAVIQGTMTLTVCDATAFVADSNAYSAIRKAIADLTGVPAGYIDVVLVVTQRHLTGSCDDAGQVIATYTITMPSNMPSTVVATPWSVKDDIGQATMTMLTAAITNNLNSIAGAGGTYNVVVIGISVPVVDTDMTTTAPYLTRPDFEVEEDGPFLIANIMAILFGVATSVSCTVGTLRYLDKAQKPRIRRLSAGSVEDVPNNAPAQPPQSDAGEAVGAQATSFGSSLKGEADAVNLDDIQVETEEGGEKKVKKKKKKSIVWKKGEGARRSFLEADEEEAAEQVQALADEAGKAPADEAGKALADEAEEAPADEAEKPPAPADEAEKPPAPADEAEKPPDDEAEKPPAYEAAAVPAGEVKKKKKTKSTIRKKGDGARQPFLEGDEEEAAEQVQAPADEAGKALADEAEKPPADEAEKPPADEAAAVPAGEEEAKKKKKKTNTKKSKATVASSSAAGGEADSPTAAPKKKGKQVKTQSKQSTQNK